MQKLDGDSIIGILVFLILLFSGAVAAITSARTSAVFSLFSKMLEAGSVIEILILGLAIAVILRSIPGAIGLFRVITDF